MTVTAATLGIDRLSVAERLELIEQIWDSLPEPVEPSEVPESHRELLTQRLAEANANPGAGKPWREVLGEPEGNP